MVVNNAYLSDGTGKNLLINGNKNINQRAYAGGVLANNVFGYDRWFGSDSDLNISQVIEQANISTGTHVLSWVGGGTATVNGVGGIVSGVPFTITVASNIKVTVPKASTKIQLTRGSVATEMEYRSKTEELALCLYYFEQITTTVANQGIASGVATSGTTASVLLTYAPKRAVPTITMSAGFLGFDGASNASSTLSLALAGIDRATLSITMVATIACRAILLNGDATVGRTITINAELLS